MAFIGTKPHEVPSNAMLGKLAYLDGDGGIVYNAITAATTVNGNDKCKLFDVTSGTFTLSFISAANLPIDWKVYVRNSGTGTITLDPSGAETIDGVSTLSLFSGETRLIYSTGTALRSVLLDGEAVLNLTEEYTSGTAGTTLVADTWTTRVVNTVKVNRINGASLSSGLITLPAGIYTIDSCFVLDNNSTSPKWLSRIFNQTASTVLFQAPATSFVSRGHFSLNGSFSLSTQSIVRIEHYAGGVAGNMGVALSIPATSEVYANITIRKIA